MTNEMQQPPGSHTPSWEHQCKAFWFALPQKAAILAMDMGTGKSLVAVNLCVHDKAHRVVVICPKTVIPVWAREFRKHAPGWGTVIKLDTGSSAKNLQLARQSELHDGPVVIVVNYESARLAKLGEWLLANQWDVAIADESHKIKSHNGKASKFVYRLGQRSKRRLGLTGTPLPHSPLDAFGQYRFLNEAVFGPSFFRFRNRYAQCHPMFKSKVISWMNQTELQAKMAPLMFRVKAEDVLDLPSEHHERLTFDLCPSANRLYQDLKNDFIADCQQGVATASNALVKLLRLQQITSGHLKLDDVDEPVEVTDTGKKAILMDFLDGLPTQEPVVVFCRFRHDVEVCKEVAEKLGRRFGRVDGARKDLTSDATMPEDIDLLAVQIQSGGVGIDLTRAAYAVYYSLGFSLGDYLQSLKRVHRPGQTRPVRYYHLIANGTVDEQVYKALKKREKVVEAILTETCNERDSSSVCG